MNSNYVKNVLENNSGNKSNEKHLILPCHEYVVLKFYDENPYTTVKSNETGIILDVEGEKKYKSNDTGEIEYNDEFVGCAQVIAVGPLCKDCEPGDDVFIVRHTPTPLPYKRMGYFMVSERNIMCRIKPVQQTKNESWETDMKWYDPAYQNFKKEYK